MTAILDYGVGNLFSLKSSFEFIGEKVIVTNDPEEIRKADRLILPGVGAFKDAAEKLFNSRAFYQEQICAKNHHHTNNCRPGQSHQRKYC